MKNVKKGHDKPIVCLDAGHYGKYNRSPAVKSYYESDMAWKLHLLLKSELESYGIIVTTTRSDKDKDLGLKARGQASKGADLFLSLHSNAVGSDVNETIDYVAIYHLYKDAGTKIDDQSLELAKLLAPVISKLMGVNQSPNISTRKGSGDHNGDGVMNDNYYGVLNGARLVDTPALILEHSFHTNTKATKWLLDDNNLVEMAKAEAKIIAAWFDVEKVSSSSTSTSAAKTYKVVTPINRYSSSADAVAQKNAKADKLAIGTYYIYNKYPTGINGVYNISTDKSCTSAGSWINPKENVVVENTNTDKLYRVRKSKDDAASQKGAFSSLDNAKECCQKAGAGYHVFDCTWKIVYSFAVSEPVITLSSIKITKLPAKTSYFVGDNFDSAGIAVTATYSDKSTKVITGYTISGFSSAIPKVLKLTVTFEGKTDTFDVAIKEKEVIAVYNLDYPEKTKIINKDINRTETDCVKAIKKILSNNASFDINIAKAFFSLSKKYGIDPMMAISQSILETGWFKYANSAVTADQHNYCGLGVTSNGAKGAAFNTIEDGVTAQLQHLFAYGSKEAVPEDDEIFDPRFNLVTRGVAVYWQQLAGRWACPGYDKNKYSTPQEAMEAGNTYGQKILTIYNSILAIDVSDEEIEKYFPSKVDEEVPILPDVTDKEPGQAETDVPVTAPVETPESVDKVPETEEPSDITNKEITEKANNFATFIFNCIKKLIQMFANLFNKGE